jgi:hypothetical protein
VGRLLPGLCLLSLLLQRPAKKKIKKNASQFFL